ncbi:hypothetical protein IMZ48_17740 [Candidatus Bathyarchaeota archaeon]|nr:hypothetical protein [Candidatus Bathyarchaeota archaeon]
MVVSIIAAARVDRMQVDFQSLPRVLEIQQHFPEIGIAAALEPRAPSLDRVFESAKYAHEFGI